MAAEILQHAAEAVGDIGIMRRQRMRATPVQQRVLIASQPAQRDAFQASTPGWSAFNDNDRSKRARWPDHNFRHQNRARRHGWRHRYARARTSAPARTQAPPRRGGSPAFSTSPSWYHRCRRFSGRQLQRAVIGQCGFADARPWRCSSPLSCCQFSSTSGFDLQRHDHRSLIASSNRSLQQQGLAEIGEVIDDGRYPG